MRKYIGIFVASVVIITVLTGCNQQKPIPVFNGINGISNAISADDLTLIKQAVAVKTKWSADKITITVLQNTGDHARGGVSYQDAKGATGAVWLAIKENGTWKIVWSGNGNISCSVMKVKGFPDAMIPDCSDSPAKK